MKKKYLVTTVAMLAAVSMLAACGNKTNNETPDTTPAVTTVPTEAPSSDERGDGPTQPEAGVDHAQMVQNIYQAVVETYGQMYLPDMRADEFILKDTLKLDASWYDAAIVEIPMMSNKVDMFAIFHATEGNLENIKNAMDAYKNYLVNDSFQYPMNMPKVQSAVVEVLDDEYVVFSILSGLAYVDMEETDEAVLISAYEESSRVAVEVAAMVISGEMEVDPWTEIDLIRNAIVKAYGPTYLPNQKVEALPEVLATYMADRLKMDASWVEDIVYEEPMISVNVDTLILVKPTEGNAENVLNALEEYKGYLVEESFQYPMNEARVQSAVVEQVGDYVCFSILGGAVENPEEFAEEELIQHYEERNREAIYAIKGYLGIWE